MKTSQIKLVSKHIISGGLKYSNILLVLMILNAAFFTALPFFVNQISSAYSYEIKAMLSVGLIFLILVFNILAYSSFTAGSYAWFCFYNKKNRLGRTVFWFKPARSFKVSRLYFVLFLKKLAIAVGFLLPGIIVLVSFVTLAMNGGIEFNLFAAGVTGAVLMMLLGAVFTFVFNQRYFLTPYIIALNPKTKIKEAIVKSKALMNGNLKNTASFKVSFAPWFVLCLTVLPICYVWPYYKQSCAILAKLKIEQQIK